MNSVQKNTFMYGYESSCYKVITLSQLLDMLKTFDDGTSY